jgi:hypothetical protein
LIKDVAEIHVKNQFETIIRAEPVFVRNRQIGRRKNRRSAQIYAFGLNDVGRADPDERRLRGPGSDRRKERKIGFVRLAFKPIERISAVGLK